MVGDNLDNTVGMGDESVFVTPDRVGKPRAIAIMNTSQYVYDDINAAVEELSVGAGIIAATICASVLNYRAEFGDDKECIFTFDAQSMVEATKMTTDAFHEAYEEVTAIIVGAEVDGAMRYVRLLTTLGEDVTSDGLVQFTVFVSNAILDVAEHSRFLRRHDA